MSVAAAALALALAGAPVHGPTCPASLEVRESPSPPAGWRDWSSSGGSAHALTGMAFSEGDPDARVILAPDSEGPRGDRYDFTHLQDAVWMLCSYSQTSRGLVRATDLRGRVCTVTGGGSTGEAPAVSCAPPTRRRR